MPSMIIRKQQPTMSGVWNWLNWAELSKAIIGEKACASSTRNIFSESNYLSATQEWPNLNLLWELEASSCTYLSRLTPHKNVLSDMSCFFSYGIQLQQCQIKIQKWKNTSHNSWELSKSISSSIYLNIRKCLILRVLMLKKKKRKNKNSTMKNMKDKNRSK